MSKIKIKAIPEAQKRTVSSAVEDFLRHCRIRNLSPRTVEYYGEDLNYFMRCSPVELVEELTMLAPKTPKAIPHNSASCADRLIVRHFYNSQKIYNSPVALFRVVSYNPINTEGKEIIL